MWRRLIQKAIPRGLNTVGKSPSQSAGLIISSPQSSSSICYGSSNFTAKSPFISAQRLFSSNPFPETDEESPTGGIPLPDANAWGEDTGSADSIFESDENSDFGFGESLSSQGSHVDSSFDFSDNPSPQSVQLNGNDDCLVYGVENESVVSGSEINEETREIFYDKLENVLSLLQSRGTGSSLESSLEGIGLRVNEEAVLKVLQTPLIPGENLIVFFRWAQKQRDFTLSTNVVDALFKTIGHEPRIEDAYGLLDLVNDIGEKEIGVLSTHILNQLICLFSNLGKNEAAYEVFTKFETFGCLPDEGTYFWVIDTLSKGSLFDLACSVCEKMLTADKLPDSEKVGKIIYYLCLGNKVNDAYTVYLWAKEREKIPPHSAVNYLIKSLCHREKRIVEDHMTRKSKKVQSNVSPAEKENVYHSLEILTGLSEEDRKHAGKPYSDVTKGLCGIGDVAGAKSLLLKMVDMGPPPGYTVFNTLITALSRAGDLEDAKEIKKMMEGRGLKPDVYSYSVIVSGYVEGGAMEEACKVLDEAKRTHKKLSPCIYYSLIRGYCKLEQFETALKYMREMKVYGVTPSADEYNNLIKLFCLKALDWRTAENLSKEMKKRGLRLYAKTKSLVQAVKELEEEGEATQTLPAE